MEEMQDPTPIAVEGGRFYTIPEVAAMTGRHPKLIARWAKDGAARFRLESGHRPYVFTTEDVMKLAERRQVGRTQPRRRRRFKTEKGMVVRLRANRPR